MKPSIVLAILSVLLLVLLYPVFGAAAFLIYLLVWVDKMILGLFRPFRYFGVELTTLATVIAAILYGPVVSFFAILVLFTILQSLRYVIIPVSVPEYPLFVPNPDSVIYAIGGIVAWVTFPFGFYTTVLTVVAVKHIMYIAKNLLLRKPPPIMGLIGGIAFHIGIIIPLGLSLMSVVT